MDSNAATPEYKWSGKCVFCGNSGHWIGMPNPYELKEDNVGTVMRFQHTLSPIEKEEEGCNDESFEIINLFGCGDNKHRSQKIPILRLLDGEDTDEDTEDEERICCCLKPPCNGMKFQKDSFPHMEDYEIDEDAEYKQLAPPIHMNAKTAGIMAGKRNERKGRMRTLRLSKHRLSLDALAAALPTLPQQSAPSVPPRAPSPPQPDALAPPASALRPTSISQILDHATNAADPPQE